MPVAYVHLFFFSIPASVVLPINPKKSDFGRGVVCGWEGEVSERKR